MLKDLKGTRQSGVEQNRAEHSTAKQSKAKNSNNKQTNKQNSQRKKEVWLKWCLTSKPQYHQKNNYMKFTTSGLKVCLKW
jgi:hypothetical protein